MAENFENTNIEETTPTNNEEYTQSDALKTFLEHDDVDTKQSTPKKEKKGLSKAALCIIIGVVAVLIIVAAVILLNTFGNKDQKPLETDLGTNITLTVDEDGEHQASLVFNEKGKLDNNSYGTLLEYTPSDIKKIEIENQSGNFTILADTKITVDEETGEEKRDATVYTLVGFEDTEIQSGGPDTIANDVCAIDFLSVADPKGKKTSDFGFDKPRATVKTTFADGSFATIIVGDDAPSQMGTYLMFGDSPAVYLVQTDAVDGMLYSVLNLITLTINDSATTTDNSTFESITLTGTNFDQKIEIRDNDDEAINTTYAMVAPKKMFVSEVEGAAIAGAIRGLYADEAVCVNPSSSQLSEYGLKNPYASLTAIFPDTTIHLKASKPDSNGSVYLIADSNIIYKIADTKVPWVHTNMQKLTADMVIDPNFNSLSKIVVKDKSGSYTFDVTTVIDTVDTTSGTTEEVTVTTAKYDGEILDSDNFQVFYQNICSMTNAGYTDEKPSGKPVLTLELSYSTGRATDVVSVYDTGNSKYIATVNGQTQSLVYKSYCEKFSSGVQKLIKGHTVPSL
ncbi:MAG: DUF4340 domain-containing protein [Ruminococcus sp.]|nr:DUF4340 domain-containing protein [Ruminococcus sp.]